MKKFWKLAAVAAATVVIGPILAAMPAGATPPTGYGFDNVPHVIVAGGSDTTYKVIQNISDLYQISSLSGCTHTTGVGPNLNKCVSVAGAETSNLANYQGDTLGNANAVGSSAGVASLNGFLNGQANVTYPGAVNQIPTGACLDTTSNGVANSVNIDFARSSRGPRRAGASSTPQAVCGDELLADTFWGFAQDGIEVTLFNARGSQVQGKINNPPGNTTLTPNELFHIYNCDFTRWSQVPSLGIGVGTATDGPIVPWGMNSSSGTYATFNSFLINNGGAPANFDIDTGHACVRKLASPNVFPLENDIKPLVKDPAALSTAANSPDNPANWVWWGSFGVFSAFPFTSAFTRSGTLVQAIAAPINNTLPSPSGIIANTYPIGRTLYHVTRKANADCPHNGANCDFNGNPGPALPQGGTDINVTGPTSGNGGAVRELTRFLCRPSAPTSGTDPLTGGNFFNEITSGLNSAGFTVVPFALRTAGSRCQVLSS